MNLQLRSILFAALLLWLALPRALAETAVLDLRQGDNLKLVFDGGLRPTHIPRLERLELEIGRTDLRFILPTGESFEATVQEGTFTILADNALGTCHFTSIDLSIPEAVKLVEQICAATGMSVEKGGNSGLSLADIVARTGTWQSPPSSEDQVWFQSRATGELRFDVTFRTIRYFTSEGAHVSLEFNWHKPRKSMRFLKEPIKPPPGYEHLSLAPTRGRMPPGKFGNTGTSGKSADTAQRLARKALLALLIIAAAALVAGGCWFLLQKRKGGGGKSE